MPTNSFILKLYAISLTFILGYIILSGFTSDVTSNEFKEITVERINVVEPDGTLVMVISNSKKQHPGMFDGEVLEERVRPPGVIFFNEEQDEVGGLIYYGNEKEGAGMALSLDQYKNDQVVQIQYQRNAEGKQQYGLNVWDRSHTYTLPHLITTLDSLKKQGVPRKSIIDTLQRMNGGKPISAQRLFTGKNYDEEVGVFIKDELGNPRIKIYIDKNNEPRFQILNQSGELVKELTSE
ncbi:hypothetical protein [Polaribacter cellanae]|uniref:Uncharacterized protein n=1 Tax=Polaribacter cellanae TaxID=2818493 RepID=A0A975H8M0_9FLAO|nr:hypothetical protein [Polaribacter cellanae]QTE24268.1 hypothetical protein J3359_08405 [Polaribacter cellanae]